MAADLLSGTFAALAHPARRQIVMRLTRGEATVQELSEPLKLSAPAISKHLKVLEMSGLIRRRKDAQWRRCRVELDRINGAAAWIDEVRAAMSRQLDQLEDYLAQIQSESTETKPRPRKVQRTSKKPGA